MHYLVDAYNLLFRFSKRGGSLKKKRQQMIEEINSIISHLPIHITLVFDGAEEHLSYPSREHFDAIELIYTSKNQSADTYISEEVLNSRSPTQITIVTNDRELSIRCRKHYARTLTIHGFLNFLSKKRAQKNKRSVRPPRTSSTSSSEFARLLLLFEKKMLDQLNDDL